MVKIKLL